MYSLPFQAPLPQALASPIETIYPSQHPEQYKGGGWGKNLALASSCCGSLVAKNPLTSSLTKGGSQEFKLVCCHELPDIAIHLCKGSKYQQWTLFLLSSHLLFLSAHPHHKREDSHLARIGLQYTTNL
jgi:hypothetical protein